MNKLIEVPYLVKNKKINKKIIVLSDIHYYNHDDAKLLDNIYDNLCKMKFNYICIPGDFFDIAFIKDLDLFLNWLKKISKLSKVIISIGNHDVLGDKKNHKFFDNKSVFDEINKIKNVHLLDNEVMLDGNIRFIGLTLPIDYYYRYKENKNYFIKYVNNTFKSSFDDCFNVLLCHSPYVINDKMVVEKIKLMKNIDLVLAGHMHGGIVVNPLKKVLKFTGLVSPNKKLFPKNVYGSYLINNTTIIISTGITKLSKGNFFHSFNPIFDKEITVVDIKKNK